MTLRDMKLNNQFPETSSFRYEEVSDSVFVPQVYVAGQEQSARDGYTTPTHTTLNVTTASQAALAANTSRKYALLINDSDTVMYLKLGADAVANQGIRLNENGGSYEMSGKTGSLYTGAINAIHGGSGNKVLLITEGV